MYNDELLSHLHDEKFFLETIEVSSNLSLARFFIVRSYKELAAFAPDERRSGMIK